VRWCSALASEQKSLDSHVGFDTDADSKRKVKFAGRRMKQSLPMSLTCALKLKGVRLSMPIYCQVAIVRSRWLDHETGKIHAKAMK
jgi:hypothetical protein